MKKIFYLLFVLASAGAVNAQIGGIKIKKPKIKKEDILKKGEESVTSQGSSTTDSDNDSKLLDDKPEYDPESLVYRAYSNAKSNIKWANSTKNGPEWKSNNPKALQDVNKYLGVARENLDKLQDNPIESKKRYLKDLEDKYAEIKAEIDMENELAAQYEQYVNTIVDWNACFKKYDYATNCDSKVLTAKGYIKIRNEFKEKFPDSFNKDFPLMQNQVDDLDRYFEGAYGMVQTISNNIDAIEKHMHLPYYLHFECTIDPGENYLFDANRYLSEINDQQMAFNYYKDTVWLETRPEMNVLQEKITKQKDFIKGVIDSGEDKKHQEEFWDKVADQVRMSPSGMNDAALLSFIKTEFAKKDIGKLLKAKIIGSNWEVSKNYLGIPLQKSLLCQVAYKKADGSCHLYTTVRIIRTYEGGGKYGSKRLVVYDSTSRMNCDNVNK